MDKGKQLILISWIASLISLIGIILNAYQSNWCWPVWIVSNIVWIYWSYMRNVKAQIFLWLTFLLANIYGWYYWVMVLNI
jgi:nicotinamide mononucleotide transporter